MQPTTDGKLYIKEKMHCLLCFQEMGGGFFLYSYKDFNENSIILFWFLIKNNPSLTAPIKTPSANEHEPKPDTHKSRLNFYK